MYSGFQLICHFQFNIEWLKASAMVFYTWQAQHASRLNLNFRPTNHLTIIRISRYSNRVDLNKICNCIIWYRNGPSYFGKRKGRFNYNCLKLWAFFTIELIMGQVSGTLLSSSRYFYLILAKDIFFNLQIIKFLLCMHFSFRTLEKIKIDLTRHLSGMTTWVVVALRAAASLDGALYLWGCKDLCRPLGRRYGTLISLLRHQICSVCNSLTFIRFDKH